MNYELPRAPSVGRSVSKDERVCGLAVDMNCPVTQEAMDTLREVGSILGDAQTWSKKRYLNQSSADRMSTTAEQQ